VSHSDRSATFFLFFFGLEDPSQSLDQADGKHTLTRLRTQETTAADFFFWFLVCYATTQLAIQLPQKHIQVVRSNKVARKRLTKSNGTPAMDLGYLNIDWTGGQ